MISQMNSKGRVTGKSIFRVKIRFAYTNLKFAGQVESRITVEYNGVTIPDTCQPVITMGCEEKLWAKCSLTGP